MKGCSDQTYRPVLETRSGRRLVGSVRVVVDESCGRGEVAAMRAWPNGIAWPSATAPPHQHSPGSKVKRAELMSEACAFCLFR